MSTAQLLNYRDGLKIELAGYEAAGKKERAEAVRKELSRVDSLLSTGSPRLSTERVSDDAPIVEVESKPKKVSKKKKG